MTKVLLVEDDASLLKNLTELLVLSNYEVKSASNGIDALSILEKWTPDIIVSDVRMPGMDGTTLLNSIKEVFQLRQLPLIFISAIVETGEVRDIINQGADDFLTKPFSFNDLKNTIDAKVARFKELNSKTPALSIEAFVQLTSREKEILALVGKGMNIKEISDALFISKRTVENHKYNIMKKLDVPKNKSLYSYLLKQIE